MEVSKILSVLVVGIISTLLIFFILQVAFARFLVDFVIENLGNEFILAMIIIGFESIVLIVALAVSLWLADEIRTISVLKSSLMAFLVNLIFLFTLSYIMMFILYPEVFSNIQNPIEMVVIFPTILIYFSIYVLGEVLHLFILSIISYYIFYVVFLNVFYEYNSRYRRR